MINCKQLAEFCLDYLDGELPDDEQLRFRSHLGECPDCVTFFETYRRTPSISREALAMVMPEALKVSIRTFLRERCEHERVPAQPSPPPL